MTTDVIALTERMPDSWSLLAALMSAGPDTGLSTRADGAVIQLSDAEGRPLASVESPMLVRVPGEAARLLGVEVGGPVWWTEVRGATGARDAGPLAGAIATRLAGQLGGTVWPPGAAAPAGGAAVLPSGAVGASAPAAEQPAVDVLTERAAVVIQDRPLVAMTAWLSDALRAATADGRALQIVTQPGTRLTLPTRTALTGLPNRWVVQDGAGGYYDGLSGTELRWQEGAFEPADRLAPAFTARGPGVGPAPSDGHQLLLTFRTRRPATSGLLLGEPLEAAWRQLTGEPPAGWGSAEPAGEPWSPGALTDFARPRAPAPTSLVVVGAPERPAALATLRISRTESGVEEEVTVAFGGGGVPSHAALSELAGQLVAEYGLVSLLIQHRTARADLTVPAWLEGPPEPVAFVLGSEAVRELGPALAQGAPLPEPHRPRMLGRLRGAGCYYPIHNDAAGPGSSDPAGAAGAAGAAEPWQALQDLMAHLTRPNGTADSVDG
ncbi:DUF6177 family protein [Streptomyces sp. N2-109]|uniref:DUF6177 family protein n=1 Tax=Streptomyces gossypii TaxID=2883101 RepID=A0ABT2JWB8_9ACTN|nr:DUF6177 family protein [Streptomyces gossypii]MCT2592176.1 DUF6177 family protein [Streptomyces gossypii]